MRGHAIKLIEEFEVMDESLSKAAGGGAWKNVCCARCLHLHLYRVHILTKTLESIVSCSHEKTF